MNKNEKSSETWMLPTATVDELQRRIGGVLKQKPAQKKHPVDIPSSKGSKINPKGL